MSVDIVVVGAGGFGRETLDVIEAQNQSIYEPGNNRGCFRVIGVADDSPSEENLRRLAERGYSYLGTVAETIQQYAPQQFLIAVGDPISKRMLANMFTDAGWRAVSVIHPSATLGSKVTLGDGNIICAGVRISTNTYLGGYVHLNANATIGHDTILEDYVSVNPGATISGEVTVKQDTLVGAASVVLQGLEIGRASIVGAGACVTRDVVTAATVMGVPAR